MTVIMEEVKCGFFRYLVRFKVGFKRDSSNYALDYELIIEIISETDNTF